MQQGVFNPLGVFMYHFRVFLIIFFFPYLTGVAFGVTQEALKQKMLEDLKIIENCFEIKYAPKEWKKSFNNWDLKEQMDLAKATILTSEKITVKDYQLVLKQLFNSPHDYHVQINFFSTGFAVLPFFIKSAEGRYFIDRIVDHKELFLSGKNEDLLEKIAVGDEILQFGGRAIHEVVNAFKIREFGERNSLSDHAMAEYHLTFRIGKNGHEVPEGPIDILIKNSKTDECTQHTFEWETFPDELTDGPYRLDMDSLWFKTEKAEKAKVDPFFLKEMIYGGYYPILAAQQRIVQENRLFFEGDEDNNNGSIVLAEKYGPLPALGRIEWKAPSSFKFRAYLFSLPDGRQIGYIRIPDYLPSQGQPRKFAQFMNLCEQATDALIIDQLDNPGGNIIYIYALASMLAKEPMKTPPHRQIITQQDVVFALKMLKLKNVDGTLKHSLKEELEELSEDLEYIKFMFSEELYKYFKFLINEWNAGKQFTDLHPMYGIEYLNPHPWGTYTKPILVLVNERDFSGGDFFPALLQDNKRAFIFGSRTAGGGGAIGNYSHPNLFGISSYSVTSSFAQRLNEQPIENLGVTPDIPYQLTVRDLQGDDSGKRYQDYIQAVHKALMSILPEQEKIEENAIEEKDDDLEDEDVEEEDIAAGEDSEESYPFADLNEDVAEEEVNEPYQFRDEETQINIEA